MNNNRGNNRRRGRGNNRQQGANQLNRVDNRSRGNALQLLDKYKKLAHDASLNGDRVQAEYYLQFADHYFRVIADNKARQDEARAKREEERGQSRDDDGDGNRNDGKPDQAEASETDDTNPFVREERRPQPRTRQRRSRKDAEQTEGNGLDPSTLPPAIAREDDETTKAPPKKRTRRTKPNDDAGDGSLEAAE